MWIFRVMDQAVTVVNCGSGVMEAAMYSFTNVVCVSYMHNLLKLRAQESFPLAQN